MNYYNSIMADLLGTINGVNKVFITPTAYVSESIRVILNGQVYEETDGRKGWTELTETTIELTEAPRSGDVLQAFYQDKYSDHLGLQAVVGTPFDPNGILP